MQYINTPTIAFESAAELVRRAIQIGAENGIRVVATVVDSNLLMVAFGKADGATPHSIETSRRKAMTAASTRRETGWMEGEFALQAPLGTGLLLTNILGGVPITADGQHIGGLGVAGATPSQDAELARAALEPFDVSTGG